MKKVLFATSALVASAGVAAADISLSGWAEMGITGGSGLDATFFTDADVTFSMSGTTDNGLTFGTSVDLDEAGGLGNRNRVAVFISGGFGTLTMGDTDQAFDWALAEVPTGSGSINDNETGHDGFSGNGGLAVSAGGTNDITLRYDNTIGGVGFAVSIVDGQNGEHSVGVGARFSVGDLGIGIGYDTLSIGATDYDQMGISLRYSMGNLTMGANYSVYSETGLEDETHTAFGVSYSMDALTVGFNYGIYDNDGGVAGAEASGFGISAGYDLGGGASILAGFESSDGGNDTWSLGVSMGF